MKKLCNLIVAAAFIAISAAAYAAVTVDENGVGFVGKGDVQLAFDWNNAQLQANADGLSFSFTSSEEVSWDCEWDTGNPNNPKSINHHKQTRTTSQDVVASIAYDARKNKVGQVTGFNLNGMGATTTTVTGDALYSCPSGGFNEQVTNSQTTSLDGGSLKVSFGGEERTLEITQ